MNKIELIYVEIVMVNFVRLYCMSRDEAKKLHEWALDLSNNSIEIVTRFVDRTQKPYKASIADTTIIGADNFCCLTIRGKPFYAFEDITVEHYEDNKEKPATQQ